MPSFRGGMVSYKEQQERQSRSFQYNGSGSCSNGQSQSFSSALLEAISRSTEDSSNLQGRSPAGLKNSAKSASQGFDDARNPHARDSFPGFDSRFSRSYARDESDRAFQQANRAYAQSYSSSSYFSSSSSVSSSSSAASSAVVMRELLSKSELGSKSRHAADSKKQPMSPGTRLANFINSLFTGTATRRSKSKSKRSDLGGSDDASTPLSVAEFFASRNEIREAIKASKSAHNAKAKHSSAASKSSVTKSENIKASSRKVSFQQTERQEIRSASAENAILQRERELLAKKLRQHLQLLEKGVIPAEYLNDSSFSFRKSRSNNMEEDEMADDDEDDANSDTSSDLFELAIDRGSSGFYSTDLPVYETTDMERNKAIAMSRKHWS